MQLTTVPPDGPAVHSPSVRLRPRRPPGGHHTWSDRPDGTGSGPFDRPLRWRRHRAGLTASPTTAWTTGQYVLLRDGSMAHWAGTAWVAG